MNTQIQRIDPFPNLQVDQRIEEMCDKYPERLMTHEQIKDALIGATEFVQDEGPVKGEFFRQQFDDFAESVCDVQGYVGVFGTGYPFYAEKDDGGIHNVNEITRYIRSFLPIVQKDQARGYGSWICGACQVESDLPDLKTICKPCDIVDFKPRDLFKALPDVDYWVIVDQDKMNVQKVESEIEQRVESAGFYVSDKDTVFAAHETVGAMKKIKDGVMPENRLPIDLHVVTKANLAARINEVPRAIQTGEPVLIDARSLHVQWEDTDNPYDFKKDFLFSFTPKDIQDPELADSINKTRNLIKYLARDKGPEIVAACSDKEARQLNSPVIKKLLSSRIENW